MARKTIFVSDFTGKEITDEANIAVVTVKFQDARKGVFTAEASADDPVVKTIMEKGAKQARRGRKPANA